MRRTTKRETVICRHQEHWISKNVDEARMVGEMVRMTEAHRIATDAFTIASIDATPEQHDEWAQQFIRLLFWSEGTRCAKCGHVASGPLTEFSPEDVARWQCKQEHDLDANSWPMG
jgi:hypothetical protein